MPLDADEAIGHYRSPSWAPGHDYFVGVESKRESAKLSSFSLDSH